MLEIPRDIPNFASFKVVKSINKGWSSDDKYYVENDEGTKYLIRISDISEYQKKKREFEMVKLFNKLPFVMSKALEFGICKQGTKVYMRLSWIEGDDLDRVIGGLLEKEQYDLGLEAGEILRQIHQMPVKNEDQIRTQYQQKILERIDTYQRSDLRVDGDEKAIKFIEAHIHLIEEKTKVYKHGDFHVGNLILTKGGRIGVIDFNRWKCGEKYEEFYKVQSFDVEKSILFSRGQIDGYFKGDVPKEFWDILAVYVAYASLHSIIWAKPFGKKDIQAMQKRCLKAFEDYNYFESVVPSWYQ